ncbi:sensor histidine kinase [Cellulomonas fimi]|uniref:Sensor-like histidine kinase SenX3 n=1 Tax=Cellulomonas fimi (strain ATCC 484 / DSM 20113 / JCM 1341 / CCUG 24087 / LMG 16345 / NBRC 15513 / NCIMB 8980 / NCTC 7547 / NRS-133) TaxID=590998 RepID=F4GY61_CELFA|nr:ATP-binding protein [Cellulomonas fimi]AEE44729.1 histidine kinase [Cellulomonas fimi ATCC 484]NNH06128.1 two-component sensor histidine kinase [Cellulomonas fimi]VEH27131.1 Signal-transduction histidine kinase senX3 [Cellulomonas fimi]
MDGFDGFALLLAGALGLLTGIGATLAFRVSERAQRQTEPSAEPELDDGLVRALAVLRSAAIVLGDDDVVVRASAPAHALGLVRDGRIVPPAIRDMVAAVRRDGVILDEELEVPRGPLGPGLLMVQVRVAQVTPQHVLVLAEDLTQARRIESMRRDFVVNVSHELKTPVGALQLLAETVHDAADDPDAVRRFTERMQAEASRLSALVHEIIELSRLQVADAVGQLAVVDVDAVLTEAVDRARTTADAKSVRLDIGGVRGTRVLGQHDLLVTAVRNLVDNAVAYSGEAAHVGVGVREAGDLVEIAVVDEGIGIPADEQDRVFERFYRVDPARSRATGGTGLGLSIVKHVAADHGGDVTVWSQPGRGSTFTIRLPRADVGTAPADDDPADGAVVDLTRAPADAPSPTSTPTTILGDTTVRRTAS